MKRVTLATLVLAATCAMVAAPAHAAFRATQVAISDADLQGFFNGIPQAINVGSDQADFQRWKTTAASVQTGLTLHLEGTADAGSNEIGVYNASDPVGPLPTHLFPVFSGSAVPGWFAEATFNSNTHELKVIVKDAGSAVQSNTTYSNVDTDNFGYYIKNASGTYFFTEDKRQTDSPQALVYSGTGGFAHGYWLCFEDSAPGALGADRDFDDSVVFIESVNPTPVTKTTWAAVKARFR